MEIRGIDVSAWQGKLTGKQLLITAWGSQSCGLQKRET